MKLPYYTVLFPILVLVFSYNFISCSRSEPRISHGFIQLVYYSGRDGIDERFSFFVLGEDDDGTENLSELYLFHDREGLRWNFDSEDWVVHSEDGKTWIGSRNIAMSGNLSLPRGQYRAVLVNKGGERTERTFTFDSPIVPPHPFPSFTVSDENYIVDSLYPINYFLGYDQSGRIVESRVIQDKTGRISDLRFQNSVRSIALWAENPSIVISALTDAVSIR